MGASSSSVLSPFTPTKLQSPPQRKHKQAPVLALADLRPLTEEPPAEMEPARHWTITPEMAEKLLDRHDHLVEQRQRMNAERDGHNRPVRWARVTSSGRDMHDGQWNGRNGETIKIACDGTIPDGQHRLHSCVVSKTPFESYIVFGVAPESQDTIDRNIKRTVRDMLDMRGETNANNLASIARWAWKWLRGVRMSGAGRGLPAPSDMELVAFINADERLRAATAWAVQAHQQFNFVKVRVWGMSWLLFHGLDTIEAAVFLEQAMLGAELPATSPVWAFRQRMMRQGDKDGKLNENEQMALMIVTWNAVREGRARPKLYLPKGGLTNANFPLPK